MDILRSDPVFYVFDSGLHQRIECISVFFRYEKAELCFGIRVCIRIRKIVSKRIRAEADSLYPVLIGQIGVIAEQVELKDAQDGQNASDRYQRRTPAFQQQSQIQVIDEFDQSADKYCSK